MSVGSHERRTARKDHRCDECDRTIPRGAAYVYVTGLFDGSWWSVKLCARCDRAWTRAHDSGALWDCHWDDDGPSYGELAEWLKEERHHARWTGLGWWKLTPIEVVRARREYRRSSWAARAHVDPEAAARLERLGLVVPRSGT